MRVLDGQMTMDFGERPPKEPPRYAMPCPIRESCGAYGIVYWPELPFDDGAYEGRCRYAVYARDARDHFAECVERACAMAGIQEAML